MKSFARPPAFALVLLLASGLPAVAQHQHHILSPKDYDDRPTGGDADAPEGCVGIDNKVLIDDGAVTFRPTTITVQPGQSVCWTWSGSVAHTIKADDDSFSSGPPSTAGTFKRTYNRAGNYGFYCQVHGTTGGGMRGLVTVRAEGGEPEPTGPGTLSFSPAAYTVGENVSSVVLTVERTGGSEGKVTVKVGTGAGSATKGRDFLPRNAVLTWNDGDQSPKSFAVTIKNDTTLEGNETFAVSLSKATGRATLGTANATVTIDDDEGCPSAAAALGTPKAAGLSRSEVRLSWAAPASGAEIHVERRQVNGAFREVAVLPAGVTGYVDSALAAATTFEYRLRAGSSDYTEVFAGATDGAIGACTEGPGVSCLEDGRFEATVRYRKSAGDTARPARRLALSESPRAGLFSLEGAGEAPLLLNVADGCNVNDHYGVTLAALTDAELDVTVRDTLTGRTWVYHNPAGRMAEVVRDTDALATCP